jgi:hypothetical protein
VARSTASTVCSIRCRVAADTMGTRTVNRASVYDGSVIELRSLSGSDSYIISNWAIFSGESGTT